MGRNIDVAFKFGCGRYIQEENAIENNLYRELKHLGTKVLIVAGDKGHLNYADLIWEKLRSMEI